MELILKSFCLLFYALSFLSVRRKSLWAFGSETGFDGNTKYFMIDVLEHHKNIRPVWITKRKKEVSLVRAKGFEAYYSFSLKGMFFSLMASKYIVSGSLADINFYTSGGAKYIQLWHGIGIKCCLWNNKNSIYNTQNKIVGFIRRPSFYLEPDYILGGSEMMNCIFSKMFRARIEKCRSTLYPRCNILLQTPDFVESFVDRWEPRMVSDFICKLKTFSRVYLYMPTYRDGNPSFLEDQKWDCDSLDAMLKENNAFLIVKLHPHMKCSLNFSNYNNICEIDKKMDIYPILPFTQTLITDYSSVFYDYILMNDKKIILYVPDIDEYIKKSRDLLMDFRENTTGVCVKNFHELMKAMQENRSVDYSFLRNKFWGEAPKRQLDVLFEEVNDI